jgi:hypothetical protein
MKKHLTLWLLLLASASHAQLNIETASDSAVRKYHIGSYSYHEEFIGHAGYGAPLILTADGGAAAFGDGDEGCMLVKLTKTGKVEWKKIFQQKGNEMESQSVVQDKNGNFFMFILVYDNSKYKGGCERAICVNKTGALLWDKFIGSCNLIKNPTIAYICALPDGRIALRGQVVTEKPEEGKDPSYHFWEAWLNSKGITTQKTGDVIDWSGKEWQKKFKPE